MADRRHSPCDSPFPNTTVSSNIIDLTDDSPSRPLQAARSTQFPSPSPFNVSQGTPSLRPSPTMIRQFAQDGSSMHNSNMQLYQQTTNKSPQDHRAALQNFASLQPPIQNQWQGAQVGEGQHRTVSGPNHTQNSSTNMRPAPAMIAQLSASMSGMRTSPQQCGTHFPNGSMSMPKPSFGQNDMAHFGQMQNATRKFSMSPNPALQSQRSQQQMQRHSSVVNGIPNHNPDQLRLLHAEQGKSTLLAQHYQQLSVSPMQYNDMAHNEQLTAESVPFYTPNLPQPGQKRPLDNAAGPLPKRQATQSSGMNGRPRANISTQYQQMGQNSPTPFSTNSAHNMSAAMIQQPGLNHFQRLTTPNQQAMERMQAHRWMQSGQFHQGGQIQQGFQGQQGTQNMQQGMQNQSQVQYRKPAQQQPQVQRQPIMQQQYHFQSQLPSQKKYQQNHSKNQAEIDHQQQVPLPHHQQREQNVQQPVVQSSNSRQPQTQFEQELATSVRKYATSMIHRLRNSCGQTEDVQAKIPTTKEMDQIKPYIQRYKVRAIAEYRNKAAAQVAASNYAQFPQQNARHQTTLQQTQQQFSGPQQVLNQQRRAQQIHFQNQNRTVQEPEQALTREQAVQQPQTQHQIVQPPSNSQRQAIQNQDQQRSADSGTSRTFVPSTNPSVIDQTKPRQDRASQSRTVTSVEDLITSPDRQSHIDSPQSQQQSSNSSPPNDDVETRLQEGLQVFFRESASPKHHNTSSSNAAASSLAPEPSQQPTSSGSAIVVPGRYPMDTVKSRPKHLKQLQGEAAAGRPDSSAIRQVSPAPIQVAGSAPVRNTAAPLSPSLHTDNGTGRVSGEQSDSSLEPANSTIPDVGSLSPRENSARGAENHAATDEASSGSNSSTILGHVFFSNFMNPGSACELLDNSELNYGLFDTGPEPVVLHDAPRDMAVPPSTPRIRFQEEQGVDKLLEVDDLIVPPPVDMSDERRRQLHRQLFNPEAVTAGQSSIEPISTVQASAMLERRIDVDWDGICIFYMTQDETRREEARQRNRQVENEIGPAVGVAVEPAFASSTGPFTSPTDAYTHRINQEIGVGWEVRHDPSLFPNREVGSVDPDILQSIVDETYIPTVFDFGHVHPAKPKADGGLSVRPNWTIGVPGGHAFGL